MKTRYHQAVAGVWYPLDYNSGRGWIIRCCDCGLIHAVKFRKKAGRRQFKANLKPRATAATRRALGIKVIRRGRQ